jgi:hypothetical protein
MLLPHVWLRRLWLRRALRGYPLYDPPHKVEEYLLSREKADENFEYFMRVREERVAYFKNWLRRDFYVAITADENGVRELNRWGNRYAGLLLVTDGNGRVTRSYFTYDPPWVGEGAGHNVLFDMGITLGEFMIANCPKLHWDVDPVSAVLPRTGRLLKKSAGMSFQRPELTGFDDPIVRANPMHRVWSFAHQMMLYMRTWSGTKRYYRQHSFVRRNIRDELSNHFRAVLKAYHAPERDPLQDQMTREEYLKFVDESESRNGED